MSKTSTNTAAVPEAKGALDRFKFEVANWVYPFLTGITET